MNALMNSTKRSFVAALLLAVLFASSCEVKPHHRYYHKHKKHYYRQVY